MKNYNKFILLPLPDHFLKELKKIDEGKNLNSREED